MLYLVNAMAAMPSAVHEERQKVFMYALGPSCSAATQPIN